MTAIGVADVTVYRPFPGEVPCDLVGADAPLDDVRVAKVDGQGSKSHGSTSRVVGAYRLVQVDAGRFAIRALGVYPAYRGAGIGRWLLGHAIGIAESRGARTIDAKGPPGFLKPVGFTPWAGGYRLVLTPE
ncbi:MAG: GNAT family N-acetyltransferase [Gammaproteobacteria bacterium]|nr:GNAT family N-acetyltransferase [Gammaproteobacteria bacterium]